MTNLNDKEIRALADAYAQAAAEAKKWSTLVDEYKKQIIALGEGTYEGDLFTVKFSKSAAPSLFDKAAATSRALDKKIDPAIVEFIFAATKAGAQRSNFYVSATAPSQTDYYAIAAE